MLAEVLLSSNVLVEQDDNAALPPAADPVSVSTLHAVCEVVLAYMAVATDKCSAVTLFTEDLEDSEHSGPSSNYVILYPRNGGFLVCGQGRISVEGVMTRCRRSVATAFVVPCV